MKILFKDQPSRTPRSLFGLSPWLVAGVSVILGLAVLALTVQGSRREEAAMVQNYTSRGEALVWALEAGTRTWMGAQGDRLILQQLVEETGKQPGVDYIAVTDTDGKILSHSEAGKIGETFPIDLSSGWERDEALAWRVRTDIDPERRVFEVRRLFAPIAGDHHAYTEYQRGHGHGRMRRMRRGEMQMSGMTEPGTSKSYVFVGLDYRPFQAALDEDYHRNLLTALSVAALGMAGFISMFWAHSHRRSRRMLMDARALAGEVITSLPLGLLTRDPEGRVGMVNGAALELLGVGEGEIRGRALREVPGLDWEALAAELAPGMRSLERETELALGDARRVPVNVAVSRITTEDGLSLGHLFIIHNIGEVKRLQGEIEKNRRLTALGNLAAGVAHEIRNPLSSIKGLATYLAQRAPDNGPEEDAARTMIGEVNRLNRVVSELLEFARPGSLKLASNDLGAVVAGVLRLAEADLAAGGVKAEFSSDPKLPPVFVNRERLTQALLNLILNAVQAMPSGGRLEIAVRANPADDAFSISVADTGVGMSEEVRASIFTPYFTTKPSGTGLGLAIVHQIVEAHGGTIQVASEPGKGSVFTLTLPLHGGTASKETR